MKVTLTSFADVEDLLTYNSKVRAGMNPHQAFRYGDNGLGSSNLSTVAGTGPACAMPKPWKGHNVKITLDNGNTVVAEVRDTGPPGRCDLNPDACKALGLKPPVKTTGDVIWVP